MSYDTLLLEQREAVLTITVNRPEVLNAPRASRPGKMPLVQLGGFSSPLCTMLRLPTRYGLPDAAPRHLWML